MAVGVGEDLDLDVSRRLDIAFRVDPVVREIALAPRSGRARSRRAGRSASPYDLHALAPPARRGLDQQREADLRGPPDERRRGLLPRSPRASARCPAAATKRRDSILSPIRLDRRGRRADPADARRLDGFREGGVLGEESVAGVDRVGADLGAQIATISLGVEVGRDGGLPLDRARLRPRHRAAGPSASAAWTTAALAMSEAAERVEATRTAISPRFAISTLSIPGIMAHVDRDPRRSSFGGTSASREAASYLGARFESRDRPLETRDRGFRRFGWEQKTARARARRESRRVSASASCSAIGARIELAVAEDVAPDGVFDSAVEQVADHARHEVRGAAFRPATPSSRTARARPV